MDLGLPRDPALAAWLIVGNAVPMLVGLRIAIAAWRKAMEPPRDDEDGLS